jgi:hypothetical protein
MLHKKILLLSLFFISCTPTPPAPQKRTVHLFNPYRTEMECLVTWLEREFHRARLECEKIGYTSVPCFDSGKDLACFVMDKI